MLTDYHVHLRPDEDGTAASEYFTAANAERYREAASERGIEELGVAEHVHRFVQSLDVWTHPWWRHWAHDDLDAYCAFVREETDLRLGIEADFVPGREDRMANLLDARDWDYVVGSVHFLRDEAVDMRGSDWDIWRAADPEKVWPRYFETLGEAARTGMFDILAHPDLVKVWGGGRPCPTATCAASTSWRWTASPSPTWRSRCPPPACASRSARSTRRAPSSRCAWRPAGPWRCRATPTGPRTWATSTSARWSGWAEIGVTELAVFERRERRLEPMG